MSLQPPSVALLREPQTPHTSPTCSSAAICGSARTLAGEIRVVKRGKIVEADAIAHVMTAPEDTYTRALMAATFDLAAVST
jgi:ABC-type microcin C transport system duplicated ATPase subunit YejF